MAKIAIFSDIHGNFEAFKAVVDDARSQGVASFACLGDIVGYGPNPSECVGLLQDLGCVCVKGNHDEDASNERSLDNLNEVARKSLEWTRGRLSVSQKHWLSELPYQKRLGRNLLVHSTVQDPEEWHYVRNIFDAKIALNGQKAPLCFYGHTHQPVCYEDSGEGIVKVASEEISFQAGSRYLINVGSVGQPRDGVNKACYVIFDQGAKTLSYRRIGYDISTVVKDLDAAGLPSELAERLQIAA